MGPEGAIFVGSFIACVAVVGVVYGLLNMLRPTWTIRWQVRSTAKHGGVRRAAGNGFQRMLGIDPSAAPWNDPKVKRRVRWIGAFEIVVFGPMVVLMVIWSLGG
jgi:hypothetical protein